MRNTFAIKRIDRYIIKKFLGTYFFSIMLIISIAIVFDVAEKIDEFLEREAPLNEVVFDYYLNFIPYFANLFSSLFTFIAVIFFTSKMAYNTEIIAVLSSGVSFKRLMYPYFIGALIIAVFSWMLMSFVIPTATEGMLDFKYTYIDPIHSDTRGHNVHRQIEPGTFIYMRTFNVRNNMGTKFSMEKFEEGELRYKLLSDYIKWDSTNNNWQIHRYYIRHIEPNGEETVESGRRLDTTLNMTPADFDRYEEFVQTMDNRQLNDFIAEQRMQGADNINELLIQKHSRTAYPFSTFILTLIGVSLSSRKVRGGVGMHIGLGLLLSFSYILFMRFAQMFAITGSVEPLVAVWIPNILFLIIGLYLYRLAPK
ncbi:MAG: LptF/LptG family permease [Bacteroidota bacterium]